MWTDHDDSMLVRCPATDSGGWQCEAWLIEPGEKHDHYIAPSTIEEALGGSR